MARQSHPTILLTRPDAQSQRFARQIGGAVISPLMRPEFLTPPLPAGDFAAVVLTSETGAAAAGRIS
ncbi:MAG: uroporphyrinogen-III synthase, partial [Cypionkella sp.]|nr:uroporphyrinogen-III synthase [Cypionkella sp.]